MDSGADQMAITHGSFQTAKRAFAGRLDEGVPASPQGVPAALPPQGVPAAARLPGVPAAARLPGVQEDEEDGRSSPSPPEAKPTPPERSDTP